MRPGRNRGWLLRLVIAFSFAQGAVSMARPAVSYRALALGADERAIGVIAGRRGVGLVRHCQAGGRLSD